MGKSNRNMIRFNEQEMLDCFRKFDYLEFKYGSLLTGIGEEHADSVPMLYDCFLSYERTKHHVLYNKIDYDGMKHNIGLIYGSSEEAESLVFLFDFSLDHLIDRYLNIEPLDKLFSEHYFEFEWRQHTDLDFKKSDLSFYRDHFVHQIRNCFMIMKLLGATDGAPGGNRDAWGGRIYYEKIKGVLKSRGGDISRFACTQVEQYKEHVDGTITSWGGKLERENPGGHIPEITRMMKENEDAYAWEYLINGSLMVAALFHDIGYPVNFTYRRARSVNEYISLVSPIDNVGFDSLNDKLENSLLFKTVERGELKRKYDALDHGALSAFILLMQFYETGAIWELNPVKRGIIELAAVAIYDHTLKYGISGEGGKPDRARPSFSENPLSYTLRFVDDLQEWDRTYFEIRGGGELMYCEKCRMPISHMSVGHELKGVLDGLAGKKDREALESPGFVGFFDGCTPGRDYDFGYVTDDIHMGKPYICGCNAGRYMPDGDGGKTGGRVVGPKFGDGLETRGYLHHLSFGDVENGTPFAYQRIVYTETSDEAVAIYPRRGEERRGRPFRVHVLHTV